MQRKLILHIGLCKTGTTSIQHFLYNNLENLEKEGICYPDFDRMNHNENVILAFLKKPYENLFFKRRNITTNNYQEKQEIIKNKLISIFNDNGNYHTYIISCEIIVYYSFDEIKSMYSFFKQYFNEIKIITYIREPYAFTKSFFQQTIVSDQ